MRLAKYRMNRAVVSALAGASAGIGFLQNQAKADNLATQQYFDANGTAAGFGLVNGQTYSWDGSFWATASTGTAATGFYHQDPTFTNTSFARINGTTNGDTYTMTVGATEYMAGMYLDPNAAVGFGVTLNVNQASSTTGNLYIPGTILQGFIVRRAQDSLVINAPITGTGAVEQELAGQLSLYGNNTFAGGFESTGGAQTNFNNSNSFGTGSIQFTGTAPQVMANTGAIGLTIPNDLYFTTAGSTTFSTASTTMSAPGVIWSGNVSLSNFNTFQFGTDTSVPEFSGVISGSGGIKIANPGTMVLAHSNSFTGGMNIAAGTLMTTASYALGSGVLTLSGPSSLDLHGTTQHVRSLIGVAGSVITNSDVINTATLQIGSTADTTYSGQVTGNVNLDYNGSGVLTFAAPTGNNFAGFTTIESGEVVFNQAVTNFNGLNNAGILLATNTGNVNLAGTWTNSGTISPQSGGSFTVSTLPTNCSAGVLTGGHWYVYNGSTISFGASQITTNAADVLLDGPTSSFAAINGLTTNSGSLTVENGRTFSFAGSIVNNGTLNAAAGGTFTIIGGTDNGTINSATGGTIIINGPFVNSASSYIGGGGSVIFNGGLQTLNGAIVGQPALTLKGINGATLSLGGTVPLATLGALVIDASSTIELNSSGTINNTGNTFAPPTPLYLNGGTINGGSIGSIAGGGVVLPLNHSGAFVGVTLNADLTASGFDLVTNGGLTLNHHQLTLDSTGHTAELDYAASEMIGGTAAIVFNGATGGLGGLIAPKASGQTLTVGSGITIATGTGSGTVNLGAYSAGQFAGTFLAQTSGQTLNVISASGSPTTIDAGHWYVYGGSSINFTGGNLAANNADILLDGANSHFDAINNLATNNGTLAVGDGRTFGFGGSITNNGTLNANAGGTILISGGTNNGTINAFTGGTVIFNGSFLHNTNSFLNGSGSVIFNGGTQTFNGTIIGDIDLTLAGAANFGPQSKTIIKTLDIQTSDTLISPGAQLIVGAQSVPGQITFSGSNNSPAIALTAGDSAAGLVLGNSNISVANTSGIAQILSAGSGAQDGQLDLGGATRTITFSPNRTLLITAQVVNGGISTSGAGLLELTRSNTYAGGSTITTGTLQIANMNALGQGSVQFQDGTLDIRSDGTLDSHTGLSSATLTSALSTTGPTHGVWLHVDRVTSGLPINYVLNAATLGNNLTIGGNGTVLLGGATLTNDLVLENFIPLNITGPITGSFGVTRGGSGNSAGTTMFSGNLNNTYTGTTTITRGTLQLGKIGGAIAIPHDLLISGGTVKLLASNQIADTANVTVSTGGELDFGSFTDTIGGLTLAGGIFNSDGDVTTNGGTSWTAGQMTGSGKIIIPNGQAFNLDHSLGNLILGRVLNNSGTINWGGSPFAWQLNNGTVNNLASGVVNVSTAQSLASVGGINAFNNAGAFNKSGNFDVTIGNNGGLPFNNSGSVNVQSGTLHLLSGGSQSGKFNVSSGAVLDLSGPHTLAVGADITGAGGLNVGNTSGASMSDAGIVNIGGVATFNDSATFSNTFQSAALVVNFGTVLLNGGVTFLNGATLSIGSGYASYGSNALTFASGTLTGGNFTGSGDVTFTNAVTWTGGTMSGSGKTIIPSGVTLTLDHSNGSPVLSRILNNSGTINWGGSPRNWMINSGTLNNLASGVVNVSTSQILNSVAGVNAFNNFGIFNKSGAVDVSFANAGADLPFNNSGTVNVQAGTLHLQCGGSHVGDFFVSSGAVLDLSGNHVLASGSDITGAGGLNIGNNSGANTTDAGIVNIGGVASFNDNATFSNTFQASALAINSGVVLFNGGVGFLSGATLALNGTANYGASPLTFASGTLLGGSLNGSGDATFTSALSWTGGTMAGSGNTIIPATATVSVNGSNSPTLSRVMNNSGIINWAGSSGSWKFTSGTLNNLSGGVVNASTAQSLVGSGASAFNNAGNFNKSGNVDVTIGSSGSLPFNNSGSINVQAGTLHLLSGGSQSGKFAISSGAVLDLSGAHTFATGADVTGAGGLSDSSGNAGDLTDAAIVNIGGAALFNAGNTATFSNAFQAGALAIANNSTVNFNTAAAASAGGGTLAGGMIAGSADLNLAGPFSWLSGTMAGSGKTVVGSSATVTVDHSTGFTTLSRILNNSGVINWTGSANAWRFNNGTLNNLGGGVVNVSTSQTLSGIGGINAFNNSGTLNKTGATDVFINNNGADIPFNNAGTVNVQVGTLHLQNGGSHTGDFFISSGAVLDLAGTHTFAVGADIIGAGAISVQSLNPVNDAGVVNVGGAASFNFLSTATFSNAFQVGALAISNGTVLLSTATPATAGGGNFSGGTLAGSADVNITGPSTWSGGTMAGTGKTIIASGATMSVDHSATFATLSRTLQNSGTINLAGSSNAWQLNGGTINNLAGGAINVSTGQTLGATGAGVNAFNNSGNFNSTASAAVTVGVPFSNQTSGKVNVSAGTLAFSTPPANAGTLSTTGTGMLRTGPSATAFTNAGTINIGGGGAVIDYSSTSPIGTIQSQIKSGFANGAWNGPGINSSAAAANSGIHRTAVGYAEASALGITSTGAFLGGTVDGTSVLLRYTYSGDANLDGTVNSSDFDRLAANFGASGKVWSDGDYNLDGIVNTLDFNAIATNYSLIIGSSADLPDAAAPDISDNSFAAAPALGQIVPEPMCLLRLAGLMILIRRQRRRTDESFKQRPR